MSQEAKGFYEFGDFRLDARGRVLYFAGQPVALKPKAVETLIALVESAGEVVAKEDLMSRVWSETFVEENTISVNVYALRKAFARLDAERIYIETVPRRGFRFAAPIQKVVAESVFKSPPENVAETVKPEIASPIEVKEQTKQTANVEPSIYERKSRLNRISSSSFSRRSLTAITAIIFFIAGGGTFYALRGRKAESPNSTNNAAQLQKTRGTSNLEAYQFYLRGRELWQTRINGKMAEGIEFFRLAIERDPNFAAPYIGIADSLSMMRNDREEWRQAEQYAQRALTLAPDSAEAHASLAFILAMNKWQWEAAENEFRRALELDENSGKAHQWYATLLMINRRFDEAETHLKRAIEIEPLSPNYNADLCELYYFANRHEDALAQCRRTNEINPSFHYASSIRDIYIQQKRYDEAASEAIKTDLRLGANEADLRNQEWYKAYKKTGFRGWMEAEIERYKNHPDALLGDCHLSVAYALIGEREKSYEHLEKAVAGRAFMLPFVNARPEFDSMRGEKRFQDLMSRVGLNS